MLKNIYLLLLLLTTSICAQSSFFNDSIGYLDGCPILDMPVCGVNKRTYQNACFLAKASIEKAYDGWCQHDKDELDFQNSDSEDDFNARTEENGYLPDNYPFLECPCNNNFRPVCGTNGITYSNACRANCRNIFIVSYGECRTFDNAPPSKKTCDCEFNNISVCASNSVTYENNCVAKCFDATVERNGICEGPCDCQFFFNPICGENGLNYINQCEIDCANVSKYSDGLCSEASKCNYCFGPIERVCGDDEKTYDNECYAKCSGASIAHEGHCVNKDDTGNCFCPKIYLPVCGRDNVTYSNECELNCEGVGVLRYGKCDDSDEDNDRCRRKCYKKKYEPVCGTNTITYYNRSMIDCDSGISVLYEGECKPIYIPNCDCPKKLDPVCGVDGRTYFNRCVANYVGVDVYCDGTCELDGHGWKMIKNKSLFGLFGNYSGKKNRGSYKAIKNHNVSYKHPWKRVDECRGNKCKDKRNRCCDIYKSSCCMEQDGRCCTSEDDDDFKIDWDRKPQHDKWSCYNRNHLCKPKVSIPYILVKKPCRQQQCRAPIKPVIYCKLPYVPNCERFNYHALGMYYPFVGNFFPYPKHIEDCLTSGFGLPKRNDNIQLLLNALFQNNSNYVSNSVSIDISISIDVSVNFQMADIVSKKDEKINDCIGKIPSKDKQIIYQYSTLYYVYFYILLKQNLCTEDTEVYSGYTVKDVLLFIVRDCWGLEINAEYDFENKDLFSSNDLNGFYSNLQEKNGEKDTDNMFENIRKFLQHHNSSLNFDTNRKESPLLQFPHLNVGQSIGFPNGQAMGF